MSSSEQEPRKRDQMIDGGQQRVRLERAGPVTTIVLDRPESLNAITGAMYAEITNALRTIDDDPETRVGVVTGPGGRAFSAGADLKEMHQRRSEDGRWQTRAPRRWDLGLAVSMPRDPR